MEKIKVSSLGKTWIFDLDGTVVRHNGYKTDGHDTLLDGAKEFLDSIPKDDMVIFITSRKKEYRDMTEQFLKDNGIKYQGIIFDAPYGERILINDRKPSGLPMSIAVNTKRDKFAGDIFEIDGDL